MSNDSKTQKIPTTGFNNSSDLRRRQSTISSVSDSAKMSSSSLASGAYAVQSPQPQSSKMPVNNYPILSYKNKLLCDLTRAIQMVQKSYLEKEDGVTPLTNSDYPVHDLCEQFDYVFLFGLKVPEEAYWRIVLEFTHKNVISDLNKLLNVTTSFGKGRAWIYHALNDNLMESYLRCFLDNKKLVYRFYKKDASLIADDQAVNVLVTLVAGLENVEFKLQNDVPYLDHSCWPTHLNLKRQVVNSIISSSSLSQLVDLNNSLNLSHSSVGLPINNSLEKKNSRTLSFSLASSGQIDRRKPNRNSNHLATNISFDATSTTSSTNNLSDLNAYTYDYNDASTDTASSDRKTFKKVRKPKNNNVSTTADEDDDEYDYEDDADLNRKIYKQTKSPINMDNINEMNVKKTYLDSNDFDSSNNTQKNNRGNIRPDQIEKEIDRLRLDIISASKKNNESELLISNKKKIIQKQLKQSSSSLQIKSNEGLNGSGKSSPIINQDLAASSLKASNHFDQKIEHIENYSKIIENATLKMDACVKDMNIVYNENYEKIYSASPTEEIMLLTDESQTNGNQTQSILLADDESYATTNRNEISVYDDTDDNQNNVKEEKNDNALISSSSLSSSIQTNINDCATHTDETSLNNRDDDFNSSISGRSASKVVLDVSKQSFLDLDIDKNNLRQEIKVDNNTKLMLSIDVFQHGSTEELVKMFHVSRGHTQGEIEPIFFLVTTHGIYLLTRKENSEVSNIGYSNLPLKFNKESFINHNQMDYIEVSLGDQAFHLVCINKRQNCWITTASRILTSKITESIQTARLQNISLKYPKISVFYEATQQKYAIKKFISEEEHSSPQDIEIRNYSLVYWEDEASAVNHLIHKEGNLLYYHKTSNSGSLNTAEWRKAYFVLKNDVLTQYKSPNDKRPSHVIKLNGEDFSGCRRNTNSPKPNTIELILSNSNYLYLSTKNEAEASDWLQCFCKIISLGNYHTDVPAHSCLPCCSIITNNKLYFCHEDLNTGFYRLLEVINLQEINRISFDNDNPFYCILHDDMDSKKNRYWFIYFTDNNERNEFLSIFKQAWEQLFQVNFCIEYCQSSEMRKRCIRGVRLIHKEWENIADTDN